ncbi:DoxX family protein [Leptospira bandrabouensis]|uniref:DoxX family protein n=1 Tax=Leptospira bandrabouensis TaxID=2484903 RepID=A0A6H3NNE5_9LEPT|nr:DoxX family protein [Leptospira bandrabouensis]MCG6152275.1 DoxX family protein [Leptospira bandrabouensis]MCW7457737.1 DoxX family protein [Leptospira bandrabouensis]MCW7477523.1 DoxX family protein [Leptospira bandrabouensis]MCW7485205.1 DoxX family protein [Leptospira bandrabouensis]TGN07377.1 DoxX family protein [Leptospira bandrabouensis]
MNEINQSPTYLWVGRILSGLVIAFLLFDAGGKLAKIEPVLKSMEELGLPTSSAATIGILLLVITVMYAIPQTATLGALLLTGYLGGAVAIHLRVGNPLWTHTLFPVYVGIFLWVGLILRNPKVKELFWF